MALTNFIPTVWSEQILRLLDTALVFGSSAVVNRDYEGEITGVGSSVKINSVGDITVKSYTKYTAIDAPQALDSTQTTLLIDQADYFNFLVDRIDEVQTRPKVMTEAQRRAVYSLVKKMDAYIALQMASNVAAGNVIADGGAAFVPVAGSAGSGEINAYDAMVDLSVKLDESDTPDDGQRYAVVTPAFYGLLLKDDRFVSGSDGARATLGSGFVGEVAGLRIYKSNQVRKNLTPTPDEYSIVAGHPMATSLAQQIVDVEAYTHPDHFGDAVRGLHVYGTKLVRPSNIAVLLSTI